MQESRHEAGIKHRILLAERIELPRPSGGRWLVASAPQEPLSWSITPRAPLPHVSLYHCMTHHQTCEMTNFSLPTRDAVILVVRL